MTRFVVCIGMLAVTVPACQLLTGAGPTNPSSPVQCELDGGFSAPDDKGVLLDIPVPGSRATIVEIWARWCQPCRQAVPALLEHRDQLEADGVRVVLLGVLEEGESVDDARATLASWGVEAPFMLDRGGVLIRRYNYADLPASVVLDAQGNIRWRSEKGSTAEQALAAARAAASSTCETR